MSVIKSAISMVREKYYSEYADKGEECKEFYQNVISILHSLYLYERITDERRRYEKAVQKFEQLENESVLDMLRCRYAKFLKEEYNEQSDTDKAQA